jgi:hypothetical protein
MSSMASAPPSCHWTNQPLLYSKAVRTPVRALRRQMPARIPSNCSTTEPGMRQTLAPINLDTLCAPEPPVIARSS